MEHILSQDDGKNRNMQSVTELSKAFALAVPHERALEIRDHVPDNENREKPEYAKEHFDRFNELQKELQ